MLLLHGMDAVAVTGHRRPQLVTGHVETQAEPRSGRGQSLEAL
jgi:hypothetical protein